MQSFYFKSFPSEREVEFYRDQSPLEEFSRAIGVAAAPGALLKQSLALAAPFQHGAPPCRGTGAAQVVAFRPLRPL